jgi:hypothetical protein
MSGSGPVGPIFSGVWQSLQPPMSMAVEDLGGLHDRLRQRRVRMDGQAEVEASAPISTASTPSAISSPAPDADDADAEHALGLRVDDQLRQAVGAIERHRAAEAAHGNFAT